MGLAFSCGNVHNARMVAALRMVRDGTMDNSLFGPIIGGVFLVAGVVITLSVGAIQSRQAHKQALRDTKRERLRLCYAKIYRAAYMHVSTAMVLTSPTTEFLSSDIDAAKQRNEYLMGDLRRVNAEAQEYFAILVLEGGNDEIIEKYNGMNISFDNYYQAVMSGKPNDDTNLAEVFTGLRDAMIIKYNGLDKLLSFLEASSDQTKRIIVGIWTRKPF